MLHKKNPKKTKLKWSILGGKKRANLLSKLTQSKKKNKSQNKNYKNMTNPKLFEL